jgi:hypothetical protein
VARRAAGDSNKAIAVELGIYTHWLPQIEAQHADCMQLSVLYGQVQAVWLRLMAVAPPVGPPSLPPAALARAPAVRERRVERERASFFVFIVVFMPDIFCSPRAKT